ncbi:MAG: ferredoxin--NADP(+) reductase [Thermoflexus sp.]|uniref:NAD(P)/FAD-dependent oxidoreductase n=1 Tax=Thermoflexus sp. TaxID=1969742 RepID=UPI00332EDC18
MQGLSGAAEPVDLVIIGAGPTGLFGAFYAGLRGLHAKIIDALPQPGGQLAVLYPEKFIYDVPGHPKIMAKDLVRLLVEQASTFNPVFCLGERAIGLRRADGLWVVETGRGVHPARAVLIAAGIGAFQPNRLGKPEIDQYEGRGLYYVVSERRPFRNKRVLIVGGGDTAVDWALNLKDYAAHITLIHRRDQFRAHPGSVAELMRSGIDIRLFHEIKAIHPGDDGTVREVVIFNNRTGEETRLPVDAVIMSLGFKADLGPIRGWGLETVGNRYIKVNARMETNLPGVYAAGDIAAPEGVEPLNLIVIGFAQAATAVNYAATYINPQAKVFPGHSSEMRLG